MRQRQKMLLPEWVFVDNGCGCASEHKDGGEGIVQHPLGGKLCRGKQQAKATAVSISKSQAVRHEKLAGLARPRAFMFHSLGAGNQYTCYFVCSKHRR
jgi:hypothetical protein